MAAYVAMYLYVIGATACWWYARSTSSPPAAKVLFVVLWPLMIPAAALWA